MRAERFVLSDAHQVAAAASCSVGAGGPSIRRKAYASPSDADVALQTNDRRRDAVSLLPVTLLPPSLPVRTPT